MTLTGQILRQRMAGERQRSRIPGAVSCPGALPPATAAAALGRQQGAVAEPVLIIPALVDAESDHEVRRVVCLHRSALRAAVAPLCGYSCDVMRVLAQQQGTSICVGC